MKILLTICARGGSKGIPGKNIKLLNGLPLIGYSIRTGLQFAKKYSADLALSTDNLEIKKVAAQMGLRTEYNRPDEYAGDTAGKIDAIRDLLYYKESKSGIRYDYIIDLDVTSPLRTIQDIERAFELLRDDSKAINIFSVSPSGRNPYFNMVEQNSEGYYNVVKKTEALIKSRQTAPRVFDINGSFYIYKRKFFSNNNNLATTDRSLIYEVPHVCFDLDEPIDFTILDIMMRENLLDFKL
ncbi:acylneuraminate cytidylyltransferase family protein [Verrucomicrobia bacterium]|nr:acylneuraminate cytidylyltransferase family protein [Verrucomicrobiota bacterium]